MRFHEGLRRRSDIRCGDLGRGELMTVLSRERKARMRRTVHGNLEDQAASLACLGSGSHPERDSDLALAATAAHHGKPESETLTAAVQEPGHRCQKWSVNRSSVPHARE